MPDFLKTILAWAIVTLILFLVALSYSKEAKADASFELTWDAVEGAGAYKAQYRVNQGEWEYIDTEVTGVIIPVNVEQGDILEAKVRGCYEINTPCSEGEFSETVSFSFTLRAPQNLKLIIITSAP